MSRPFYSDAKTAKMCCCSSSNSSSSHFIYTRFFRKYWRYRHNYYTSKTVTIADVPFVGFVDVDIAPHFGVKYPQNPKFWSVNRRFQGKRAKYWKFQVIELTASILTKFGVTIETTKWSSWVVPIGAQQIQDGGRPPFWKPLNWHIFATVLLILMKFSMMTHTAPLQRIDC